MKNRSADGIFLYLAPEANDYDSLAGIGFSRFSSKLTAFQTHQFLMQSFMWTLLLNKFSRITFPPANVTKHRSAQTSDILQYCPAKPVCLVYFLISVLCVRFIADHWAPLLARNAIGNNHPFPLDSSSSNLHNQTHFRVKVYGTVTFWPAMLGPVLKLPIDHWFSESLSIGRLESVCTEGGACKSQQTTTQMQTRNNL